jgi:hypothetical protein
MGTRPNPLSKATSKTLQGLEAVVDRRIRPCQDLPRVMTVAEVEEDSPTFPASHPNCPMFSVVLGLETERFPKMLLPHLVLMLHHMLLPSRRTTTDRIGLSRQSPLQTNLQPTRRLTHHHMRLTTLGHPEEAINPPTMHLHSLGLVVERGDTVRLGVGSAVVLGIIGLRNSNHNHRTTERARAPGKEANSMGTLGELQNSLTLSDGLDFELVSASMVIGGNCELSWGGERN